MHPVEGSGSVRRNGGQVLVAPLSWLVWLGAAAAGVSSTGAAAQGFERTSGATAGFEKGKLGGLVLWSVDVPLGSIREHAADPSPIGFELQLRRWLSPELSLGASGQWNTYLDERPRSTYERENAALTATAYNDIQLAVLRLLLHYYPLESGWALPYVGPHVGIGWARFRTQTADLELSESDASISIGAEAGAFFPMGPYGPKLVAGVRYSLLPALELARATNMQAFTVQVGLGF
jgi:hypothetical protein